MGLLIGFRLRLDMGPLHSSKVNFINCYGHRFIEYHFLPSTGWCKWYLLFGYLIWNNRRCMCVELDFYWRLC